MNGSSLNNLDQSYFQQQMNNHAQAAADFGYAQAQNNQLYPPPVVQSFHSLPQLNCVTFCGHDNAWVIRVHLDPLRVELNPEFDGGWDGAAKTFWNSVAKLVGQEPPFGW